MSYKIKKILIIRLSSLGDIVHTYPMIYDIKKNIINCKIDWLVDEAFAELIELNPLVDNVIKIPLRAWKKNKLKFIQNIKNWQKSLNNTTYDYIIDSQGLLKSAMLAKIFKGCIHGFDKHSIREKVACIFYDYKYNIGKNWLAITKNRLLCKNIFNYRVELNGVNFGLSNKCDNNFVLDVLDQSKIPMINKLASNKEIQQKNSGLAQKVNNYVIFFHGTSKNNKKYPIVDWVNLAKYLISKHNLCIVLPFGNEAEKNESHKIKHTIMSENLYIPEKRLNYTELSLLIVQSYFVFGVDTGLLHLANALDKRLIAIYTATNPSKTGIFESARAKNIGQKGLIPTSNDVISLFENIIKT